MQLTKADYLRQAQQLLEQGRVSSAIRIYQQIIDEDPSDLNVISALGELYVKANRVADAVDHFARIAGHYLKNGSAKSASYILNKALKLDSASPKALTVQAELHLHDKDVNRAHDVLIEVAAAYWHEGNFAAAIGTNQRALEIMPDSRQAKAALEFIKQEMEPPPPPEPAKKEIVFLDLPEILISIPDSDPESAPTLVSSGPEPAPVLPPELEELAAQREFVPGDEDSIVRQIAVAEFLVGCGQVDRAVALLKGNLQQQPDHIQTREKLKDIYLRSEMADRASEECVNIAAIYLARGDSSRAAEYVARARVLSPFLESASVLTAAHTGGEQSEAQKADEDLEADRAAPVVM